MAAPESSPVASRGQGSIALRLALAFVVVAVLAVVIVAGLVCYLTTLGLLGLAPEERRLVAGARARLGAWSAKRRG